MRTFHCLSIVLLGGRSCSGFVFPAAFQQQQQQHRQGSSSRRIVVLQESNPNGRANERRDVLAQLVGGSFATLLGVMTTATPSLPAAADEEDLASKLFNADGSLKNEEMITEAKSRTVNFQWDATDKLAVGVDGVNTAETPAGSSVSLSYNLPEKWGSIAGDELYLDRSEGVNAKACTRITVYQAPGKASPSRLSKATRVGIAKSLDVSDDSMKDALSRADLIGGRTRVVKTGNDNDEEQLYYEFDMALAPKTCSGSSEDDLRLGFCPYENIYLLSATVLNERLYVCCVASDKLQWKRANADLRRARSSFTVRQQV